MIKQDRSAGFSAIELLVTLFIASALVVSFYQLFLVIDEGNSSAKFNAVASDLASSNLSKYPTKASTARTTCSTSTTTPFSPTPATLPGTLPGVVAQEVEVSFPFTCGLNDDVVKVKSSVTYGPTSDRKTVVQATYVD